MMFYILYMQGIVHRDVKPGNFLFSCKAVKGYLIDFNLAMVSDTCLHLPFGMFVLFFFLALWLTYFDDFFPFTSTGSASEA